MQARRDAGKKPVGMDEEPAQGAGMSKSAKKRAAKKAKAAEGGDAVENGAANGQTPEVEQVTQAAADMSVGDTDPAKRLRCARTFSLRCCTTAGLHMRWTAVCVTVLAP